MRPSAESIALPEVSGIQMLVNQTRFRSASSQVIGVEELYLFIHQQRLYHLVELEESTLGRLRLPDDDVVFEECAGLHVGVLVPLGQILDYVDFPSHGKTLSDQKMIFLSHSVVSLASHCL